MEGSVASLFFFGQKVTEEEKRFYEVVNSLYDGVKESNAAKQVSDASVQKFSKEIVGNILTDILKVSFFDLLEINMILCKRTLLSYHAKNSYQIKVRQQEQAMEEIKRRRR